MTTLPQLPKGLTPGAKLLLLWLRAGGSCESMPEAAEQMNVGLASVYRWYSQLDKRGLLSQSESR